MSDTDTVKRQEWPSYPHGYTPGGVAIWPAFTDTQAVWARCKHCTHDVYGETFAAAGVNMVWHLYDEHPGVWRTQYGAFRRPAEGRPADLDTAAIDGDRLDGEPVTRPITSTQRK